MKHHIKTTAATKRSRSKLVWVLCATIVVFLLLYWEQAGVLYVLSTLAMCALLIVIAFSDLEAGYDEVDGKDR